MRSLKRRFENKAKKHFGYSDYLIFCEAIRGQNFSERTIRFWFGNLVNPSDYIRSDKKSIITHLLELNKPLEDGTKSDKIGS